MAEAEIIVSRWGNKIWSTRSSWIEHFIIHWKWGRWLKLLKMDSSWIFNFTTNTCPISCIFHEVSFRNQNLFYILHVIKLWLIFVYSTGPNADSSWVPTPSLPCLIANSSMVSVLLEQRIRKFLFFIDDRIISNIQADISHWKGTLVL